jgi:site-specific recombinase XerD
MIFSRGMSPRKEEIMLEQYRIRAKIRDRILAGPLGAHVDAYVSALVRDGYSELGIRRQIRGIDVFGAWLARGAVAAQSVDTSTVEQFVKAVGRTPSRRCARGRLREVASCARRFAGFLWVQGIAQRGDDPTGSQNAGGVIQSFDDHLRRVKGLAPGTRKIYLRYTRLFIGQRLTAGEDDGSPVRPEEVVSFVRFQASQLKPSSSRAPVSAMRAFLRFLACEGKASAHLERAVATIRQWKHASLPAHLPPATVEQVLARTRGQEPLKRRDYALLLLLARLGLRASEVAFLELRDVDWQQGVIRVRSTKTGRDRRLPLPREVGDALVDYLRHGRPDYQHSRLFLRASPPHGPLTPAAVTAVAKRALTGDGVEVRKGAHAFRHTAATQMVRRGATFKEVADVLGHGRIETTAIYAKLDLDTLADVALPWPGGGR